MFGPASLDLHHYLIYIFNTCQFFTLQEIWKLWLHFCQMARLNFEFFEYRMFYFSVKEFYYQEIISIMSVISSYWVICLADLSCVSSQAQITQPQGNSFGSRLVFALGNKLSELVSCIKFKTGRRFTDTCYRVHTITCSTVTVFL